MAITKVEIIEGCISCGLCEETCPEVFKLEDTAIVRTDAVFEGNEDGIKDSAASCPVEVIKYEES